MPNRRQATVMFTDVVGFTSIMEQSETEAMRIYSRNMEIVRKLVSSSGGTLVKEMGDGTLSVFTSSPAAVSSAVEIQKQLEDESFRIRIGIHSGSVLFEGNDIFGDTVNVASRLEKKSPAGGILISREVLSHYGEKNQPDTINLGLTRLKGLGRLLQIHCLGHNTPCPIQTREVIPAEKTGQTVLSVFPFVNNGAREDEFYAYGIYTDLLTDLGKADSISVVPLTSLLQAMRSGESDEEIVGRFGSRTFVKGSIARNGSSIKLSLALKEIESGRIIWQDTWIEKIDDLPAIKGKLADSILKALGKNPEEYPGVTEVEVDSVSVYEKYLRAMHLWKTRSKKEHVEETRKLLLYVVDKEPEMIPARVLLAETYRNSGDFSTDMTMLHEAENIALRTDNHAGLLSILQSMGVSHWIQGETAKAHEAYEKAMCLAEENHMRRDQCILLNNMALLDCDQSKFSESLDKLKQSLQMSKELESLTGQAHTLCNTGLVYLRSGKSVEALNYFKRSLKIVRIIRDQTGEARLLTNMGIIYNDLGELEFAYETAEKSMVLSREQGDKRSVCNALNNMGSAMLSLGVHVKAGKYFLEALELSREIGLKKIEGVLLTNTAIVKIQTGAITEAEQLLRQSLSIALKEDDKEGIVENRLYLSEIFTAAGDTETAASHLSEALEISREYRLVKVVDLIQSHHLLTLAKTGTGKNELLKLLRDKHNAINPEEENLREIYWKWAETYDAIAESSDSPEEKRALNKKAIDWKKAALKALHNSAAKIQSEEYRSSFLNNIPLHREIQNQ